MIENYKRLYFGKTKREVEAELHYYLDNELHDKYGEQLDDKIVERVRQEWHAIEVNGNLMDVAILHELCDWMRQNSYAYWLNGTSGGGFILYLLGVAAANPLPAHYHCPKCHSIVWNEQYKSGFDLSPDLGVCHTDGITMMRDGHDIPWQTLWGYRDDPAYLNLRIDPTLKEPLYRFFQSHWLNEIESDSQPTIPYPEHESLFHFSNISFDVFNENQKVPNDFYQKIIDADSISALLENPALLAILEDEQGGSIEQPTSFADFVYSFGLLNGTGTWDDVAEFMIDNLAYAPSDLIAFRDDVYKYMLDHDFEEKDAWRAAERVRKGRGLPFFRPEMMVARDKWVLHRISETRYLLPKAHAIEFIFFKIKCLE